MPHPRFLAIVLVMSLSAFAVADEKPVSFSHDVQPILKRSCAGCHRPEKLKGKLDLTTFAALEHGGKHGPIFVAGDPAKSPLVQQVSGDDPEMPDKGEKLTAAEVAILSEWVKQGAKDDSPAGGSSSSDANAPQFPPTYALAPEISAMALSPQANALAIGGSHEVLLVHPDGAGIIARLPTPSAHIKSLVFTVDGSRLVAAGGSAGVQGRIDVFDVGKQSSIASYIVSADTLFGLSLSPTGDRAAVGCADHSTRVISLADGKELDHFNQHTDWALATAFNLAGDKLVSAGRDKAVWLLDLATHRPFDLVNYPTDPILCVAHHPKEETLATGAATGAVMIDRLHDLVKTTEANRDPNRLREMEHQNGPANAIAYSPDGKYLAVASTGEVRIYTSDGNRRLCTCSGAQGAIFTIAFTPDASQLYAAGFDGKVRLYGVAKGDLRKTFEPFPMPGH